MKRFYILIISLSATTGFSQTLTDGLMMPKKSLCTGFLYTVDQWKNYWEGTLKRDNQNIGTITTQSIMWMGSYGLTEKINLIAMAPYVMTKASGGTLHGQLGVQDLTVGGKYNFFRRKLGTGTFNAFALGTFSTPLTNYTPDFFPLSLGFSSTNLSARLTANFKIENGFYVNSSAGYTWRSNVKLDRTSYYSNNAFYETNEVKMPNVFDYNVDVGYHKNALQVVLTYMQMNTLGGGDIRRQDMPFVSNQMNFSKIGTLVMYYLPKPKGLAVRAAGSYVVAGRNVGQAASVMGGLMYTINFSKS
jgi:hypothetical protein